MWGTTEAERITNNTSRTPCFDYRFQEGHLIDWFPANCLDKLLPLNKILCEIRRWSLGGGCLCVLGWRGWVRGEWWQVLIWDFSQTDTLVSILKAWGCDTSHPSTHKHTCTHAFCWSLSSIPAPLLLIPDHRRVAITQVFYRSFQRKKIRAIVSEWSYGQKLHSYWVHLCLWLRSLHTDGASLLGNGAFEGYWLGLRADAVPPHPLHPFQFPSPCHTQTHTHARLSSSYTTFDITLQPPSLID